MATNHMKIAAILLTQLLVYLVCRHCFELYAIAIVFSIAALFYIVRNQPQNVHKRVIELTIVETFFVALLYCVYYIGHNAVVSKVILFMILLPQAILFIRASFKAKRYLKSLNTSLHLFVLIYFSLQSAPVAINFLDYPAIFDADSNQYYGLLYLVWVIPFLISGDKFYAPSFILVQVFSIVLSFLHEDFLSMRLFTAQISFILVFLLKMDFQLASNRYLKRSNAVASVLSSFGIFILIISYFLTVK